MFTYRQATGRDRSICPLYLCSALLAIVLTLAFIPVEAQTAPVLSRVNKIYVERLGHGKLGDQFRERVMARLRKRSNLEVVAVADYADAILRGTSEVWVTGYVSSSPHSPSMSRQAVYSGFLSARITGKDNEVLWSYLVTPSKFAWGGIISDLADSLVSRLLEARSEASVAGPTISPTDSAVISLHGAGATFPAPLYEKWFETIQRQCPNESIAYEGVGSEDGIDLLAKGKIDFAASDMPVSDERMSRNGLLLQHFPSGLGAVVPVYNLANVTRPLNFTGEVLAENYMGN
jgi:PBP superfamily domain